MLRMDVFNITVHSTLCRQLSIKHIKFKFGYLYLVFISCAKFQSHLFNYLQLGMLMPAGMPLPAYVRTSSDVKSGRRNLSFSKPLGQGSSVNSISACCTRTANFADISLFTTATKPSNSPRIPAGSRYVSMKPMYLQR